MDAPENQNNEGNAMMLRREMQNSLVHQVQNNNTLGTKSAYTPGFVSSEPLSARTEPPEVILLDENRPLRSPPVGG